VVDSEVSDEEELGVVEEPRREEKTDFEKQGPKEMTMREYESLIEKAALFPSFEMIENFAQDINFLEGKE
jgi:hypothetical protein